MATNLVRFDMNGATRWGVVLKSGVSPLTKDYPTTAALIERGKDDWLAAQGQAPSLPLELDQDPVARDDAVPHLLPGSELPSAYDRIRNGSGREALQHVLHEVRRIGRFRARSCYSAEARVSSRL